MEVRFFTSPNLRFVRPGKDVTTLILKDSETTTDEFGDVGGKATTADGKTVYITERFTVIKRYNYK